MEQLAYEEASELYERALEVLELEDEPDERRRLSLSLAMGGAEASAAQISAARRAFGQAAESARALGDADGLVGAAIGIAMLSEAGKTDERLIGLIDEALEAIGPEPSAARASLLSAKSQELYWQDAQGLSAPLVEEAIEIARQVDAPQTLGGGAAPPDLPAGRPRCGPGAARDRGRNDRAGQLLRRPRGRAARARLPAAELPGAGRHRRRSTASWRLTRGWPTSCGCRSTSGRPMPCAACARWWTATSRPPSASRSNRGGRASAPNSRWPSSTTACSCSSSEACRGARPSSSPESGSWPSASRASPLGEAR